MQPSREKPFQLPTMRELARVASSYHLHRLQPEETVGVFRIREVLSRQGNVSTVYLAEATVDVASRGIRRGGRYIIKGIPYHASTSQSTNARNLRSFFNEIRVLPHVPQPSQNNIVKLVDANGYPSKGKLYMAFEELAYQSVREKYPDKRLDPDIVLLFASGLSRALTHLHSWGIVHGDIKPDNFMIDVRGEAVLVDFGSSFFAGRKGGAKRRGMQPPDPDEYREPFTPLYCSPELARYKLYGGTFCPKEEASDAWALGVTLWELLAGERPFSWMKNESLSQILEEIGRGTPPVRQEVLDDLVRTAPRKSVASAVRLLQTLVKGLLHPDSGRRMTCFMAHNEISTFLKSRGGPPPGQTTPDGFKDRLEMARRIAQLDEPAGGGSVERGRARGRDTAAMELRTLELREAYLKEQKARPGTVRKGWFTPPVEATGAAPPPAGSPPPGTQAPREGGCGGGTKKGEDFETFRRKRSGGTSRTPVSFDDFVRKRKEEEVRRMKEFCDEGGDTQVGRDTQAGGTRQGEGDDLAETRMEDIGGGSAGADMGETAVDFEGGEGPDAGSDDDSAADTKVDPNQFRRPKRPRTWDPDKTRDE